VWRLPDAASAMAGLPHEAQAASVADDRELQGGDEDDGESDC